MRKLLFFDPYNRLWKQSLALRNLISGLSSYNSIYIVRCAPKVFDFCTSMEYRGISPDDPEKYRVNICLQCSANQKMLDFPFKLSKNVEIRNLERVESTLVPLSKLEIDNLFSLEEIINLDKISLYEPLIKYKKTDTDFNENEMRYFHSCRKVAHSTYSQALSLLDEIKPDLVFLSSPQYTSTGAFGVAAIESNTPCYFLEGGSGISSRYTRIRVWDWTKFRLENPFAKDENWMYHKYSLGELRKAILHFKRIRSGNSYSIWSPTSTGVNIREYFGVPQSNRLILLALSSSDEVYSALAINGFSKNRFESKVFKTQFEWVEETIKFVENRPNINVVIRLHPRDFYKAKDSKTPEISESGYKWLRLLSNTPKNVFVDLPEMRISISDYFKFIDVFVTGWSSTALEALECNIPVITYDYNLPSFPSNLHFSGNTRDQYWNNLMRDDFHVDQTNYRLNVLKYIAYRDFVKTLKNRATIDEAYIFQNIYRQKVIRRIIRINPNFFKKLESLMIQSKIDRKKFEELISV